MTFNSNKINLPKSITIKLKGKFKVRHMVEREPILFHVMLRQGFNLFTLASCNPPNRNCISQHRNFSRMNFNIRAECEFLFHNLCCSLPKDTVDVEVTMWTVGGIHTYRRDRTTQVASYSPWNRQLKPFPFLRKKITEYQEEKSRNFNPFTLVREMHFNKKTKRSRRSQKSGKYRKLDMGASHPPMWHLHAQQPLPQQPCLFLPTCQTLQMCQLYPSH